MKKIRKKILISFISALFFCGVIDFGQISNNTTTSGKIAFSAEYFDSFTEEFSNMQDTFSDNPDDRKNSLKKEVKEAKKGKAQKNKKPDDERKYGDNGTNLDIKSDTLEYYPERQEIEAVGHASIILPQDGSTLRADRLILNQETGILKGFGDVRLIKGQNVMDGDSITIHLKEKNALMENPITENMQIRLNAETAKVIAGKDILVENGVAVSKEDKTLSLVGGNFNSYGTNQLADVKRVFYLKEKYDEKYTIKTKEIVIDAKAEHDTVTMRDADIFIKDMKIASSGKIKLITNKEQQYIETNMPEIGFIRQIGSYVGPGFAFEAPFGGAMKVAPFLNVFKGKVGVGGMARYHNDKNTTEFAISSVDETETILRGRHEFTDKFAVQYGMNGYMDEWFLGDRVAGKLVEAVYRDRYTVDDLGLKFEHRISAGIAQDFRSNWSTARVRWMGDANKPIWYYGDDVNNRYASFNLRTQGVATVYGSGDTLALLRFGPNFRIETDRWIQNIGYFYTAKHGETPFMFDRYRYGTNNVYLSEGIKLNKYLSVLWSGSLALARDSWDKKLMQENRFYVMVGPEDLKFTLGYDTVRQRTVFNCFFIIGTKNTSMEFKKLYIKNPDKLGVSQHSARVAEKAQLEAKAEIKPSLTDKLLHRTKDPQVEPEREEKILVKEEELLPIVNRTPTHEIIIPQVKERKNIPQSGVSASRWNSGRIRLHDEATTPMLTPMVMPIQGY